jgi:glycosyltransferase involved in cell wall biosynthesis
MPGLNGNTSAHLENLSDRTVTNERVKIAVTLLTGGDDPSYVYGLTNSLTSHGVTIDLIGSDQLDRPEYRGRPDIQFFNLRGSLRSDVSFATKTLRILRYYLRLMRYTVSARPALFHILWNNKFESFDRTALMLFYRAFGKKTLLTAHNVNAAKRDLKDTFLNRVTLRVQYRLADHIFVHTDKMKEELEIQFGVPRGRVTVIPFGINDAVPKTNLSRAEAKQQLGLRDDERAILFFGRIAPYKGLQYLISAFQELEKGHNNYRLMIAGRPDKCEEYWARMLQEVQEQTRSGRVLLRAEHIPEGDTEIYFKAADVLVLPYTDVFQSGVLFLGQSFGLPVIASRAGSLDEEIVDGENGFTFKAGDSGDLASSIERYFASDIYAELSERRHTIRAKASEQHSWNAVGQLTLRAYSDLLKVTVGGESKGGRQPRASMDGDVSLE